MFTYIYVLSRSHCSHKVLYQEYSQKLARIIWLKCWYDVIIPFHEINTYQYLGLFIWLLHDKCKNWLINRNLDAARKEIVYVGNIDFMIYSLISSIGKHIKIKWRHNYKCEFWNNLKFHNSDVRWQIITISVKMILGRY